jgi:hypothetical protein
MTRVVEVPAQLDDRSFDQFARAFSDPTERRLLFDAHATQWASPYGLVGLLAAGQAATERGPERPLLTIPGDRDVAHYWGRAGFFEQAADWFEIHGKVPRVKPAHSSDVLLEITPVRGTGDVHSVVETIQARAAAILSGELGLEATATMGFAMALSEARPPRWASLWRFRRRVRILLSTPGPPVGWRCRPITGGGDWAAGWW